MGRAVCCSPRTSTTAEDSDPAPHPPRPKLETPPPLDAPRAAAARTPATNARTRSQSVSTDDDAPASTTRKTRPPPSGRYDEPPPWTPVTPADGGYEKAASTRARSEWPSRGARVVRSRRRGARPDASQVRRRLEAVPGPHPPRHVGRGEEEIQRPRQEARRGLGQGRALRHFGREAAVAALVRRRFPRRRTSSATSGAAFGRIRASRKGRVRGSRTPERAESDREVAARALLPIPRRARPPHPPFPRSTRTTSTR